MGRPSTASPLARAAVGRSAGANLLELPTADRSLPDAAVDLVYLDPPFNSNRDDNVIFRDESGKTSDARLLAFEDTWQRAILGPARVLVHDDGHRGGMGAESDSVEGDLC
jgi:16S rRNA G966 N2-methylase RsmD